ncbi:MAG: VOC family protein [Rubrivivax sp.]
MSASLDHLVVAAHTLEQGAAWCEALLGATPAPGGKHVGMGTHNRLLAIGSPVFPMAYLEIIAIDPDAPPPNRPRWFGLDDGELQGALRLRPRLLHMVARSGQLDATLAALGALGIDAGRPLAAERATARGPLRWRIAGRADGRLLLGGALPTLIEWQGTHPTEHLPPSAVSLRSLELAGLPAPVVAALGLQAVLCLGQGPALRAWFDTPRGPVHLDSGA